MSESKFAEIIKTLTDSELKVVIFCLTNEKSYRAMQIVMKTPGHSRPVQVESLKKELERRNWSFEILDKDTMKLLK